jgi:hypothetical protein
VFAFMLLGPVTVKADEAVAVLAPVAAPSVDETNADAVRAAAQVLAAQQALRSPNLGSLQEAALIIVVTTGATSDATQSADDLPAALANGTRSETAHLATLILPD